MQTSQNIIKAKAALDNLIKISRVHLYKPIQVAEILYHHRIFGGIDLSKLEDYRKQSKKWRDDITLSLLGRKCTSSAKFQDNLFEANAIPPEILEVLGEENVRTSGGVEAYIYGCFDNKHDQLSTALDYCLNATPKSFYVKQFIDSFWNEPGLKRSLDKVYEIIVYSLFSTLVDALNLQVGISVDEDAFPLLKEFEDFSAKVMCLDSKNTTHIQEAKVYRIGVTNAADRGLDMYSNWGPAIQIKHLSLDADINEQFVLGRNILQAYDGNSYELQIFIDKLDYNIKSYTTPQGDNHILNGILYEIYFNSRGEFRTLDNAKCQGDIDRIFSLQYNPDYKKSFSFISGLLAEYEDSLYYIPNSDSNNLISITVIYNCEKETDILGNSEVHNVISKISVGTIDITKKMRSKYTICNASKETLTLNIAKCLVACSQNITYHPEIPDENLYLNLSSMEIDLNSLFK